MSLKKKLGKKIRHAGKTFRFCLSCTKWGEYDIEDFKFTQPNERTEQDEIQATEIFDSFRIYHTVSWFMLHGKTRLPFNDLEEALWEEDFAVEVPVRPGMTCPVLKVCLGFQDHELRANKQLFYYSYTYKKSNWDKALLQSEFALIASQNYPDDPIIDGLPATVWLECVEPTLCIMLSLCRLKHRKSNITSPKKYPEYPDSAHSRHGDYEFGPVAIFAGHRRASLRVDFVLQHIQDDAASIIEMSYHSDRSRNRRRRQAANYRSFLQREMELLEGNKNQSANPAPCDVERNVPVVFRLSVFWRCLNSTNLTSSERNQEGDENQSLALRDNFDFIPHQHQIYNVTNSQRNRSQTGRAKFSVCSAFAEEYDGNTNQSAIRYPADSFKLTPVLYIWNSESRTSDVETAPANRYEMMSSVHFSYKLFATARPNTEEHSIHGRNVCELASMDPVVRRYLLQSYNKPPSKTDTWFDRVYTEHYLRTEKDPDPVTQNAELTQDTQEHLPLRRKIARNIRSSFQRFQRWYCIRTFWIQREVVTEVRRRFRRRNRQNRGNRNEGDDYWQERIDVSNEARG